MAQARLPTLQNALERHTAHAKTFGISSSRQSDQFALEMRNRQPNSLSCYLVDRISSDWFEYIQAGRNSSNKARTHHLEGFLGLLAVFLSIDISERARYSGQESEGNLVRKTLKKNIIKNFNPSPPSDFLENILAQIFAKLACGSQNKYMSRDLSLDSQN